MSAGARRWTVRLTAAAEADFEEILRWTVDQFGEAQARIYAETLSAALNDLAAGPSVIGARKRDDILKGLFTLHVVLRLLHDAMDLQRHLPPADEST